VADFVLSDMAGFVVGDWGSLCEVEVYKRNEIFRSPKSALCTDELLRRVVDGNALVAIETKKGCACSWSGIFPLLYGAISRKARSKRSTTDQEIRSNDEE
jgi:hypothetical protein